MTTDAQPLGDSLCDHTGGLLDEVRSSRPFLSRAGVALREKPAFAKVRGVADSANGAIAGVGQLRIGAPPETGGCPGKPKGPRWSLTERSSA